MKNCHYVILFTVVIATCWPTMVNAWPRYPYSDPVVVERAELIVAAHVKERSIEYIPHATGSSWEHHAVLIVDEVLKGTLGEHELPIIIHYGLDPKVPGTPNFFDHSFSKDTPEKYPDPSLAIYIYDDGGMDNKISGDIRKDHLWFLRLKDSYNHRRDSTDALGIWDPQDIRPLELKSYFQAFVSGHPEEKLKEYAEGDTPLAVHARVYLDHLKIEEIIKEPDVNKRADSLLPFCLFIDEQSEGPTQREAILQMGQISGTVGVSKLVPIFSDPKYAAMQCSIMYEWANAQYHEAIPLLIDKLKAENKFWVEQGLTAQKAWVSTSSDYDITTAQNESRVRLEAIFYVFKQVPDVRTIPVLRETKQFWDNVASRVEEPRNLFSKACEDALMSIQNDETEKATK